MNIIWISKENLASIDLTYETLGFPPAEDDPGLYLVAYPSSQFGNPDVPGMFYVFANGHEWMIPKDRVDMVC